MREEDILEMRWVADPQMSPDGRRIAFTLVHVDVEADDYRTNLWLAEVPPAGQPPRTPRALTFHGRDSQPRWSPDGRMLAFVRRLDADTKPQLWLLPLDGGEAWPLVTLRGGASSPAWSPDGRRIAFTSGHHRELDAPGVAKPKHAPSRIVRDPVFRWNNEGFVDPDRLDQVWVVEATGGDPRPLTASRRWKCWGLRWTPDGSRVAFLSDRREHPWHTHPVDDVDVWTVAADRDAPGEVAGIEKFADIAGPLSDIVFDAAGRLLAVGGIRPDRPSSYDQNDLLLFEAGPSPRTQPRSLLGALDVAVGEAINSDQHPPRGGGSLPVGFAAGGHAAIAAATWHGASRLLRVDLASGEVRDLLPGGYDLYAGSLASDGSRAALAMGRLDSAGALYVLDTASGECVELFDPNADLLRKANLGRVEEFWTQAVDGTPLQGWIVKPPDFDPSRKYPLVLQIHGGPHTAYGVGFFHEFRVLAAAGVVVLYTNPRGSTSYGQAFANVIQYHYPGDDFHDLMTCVDHVIAQGYVDEARMGVTGGSGGGLLTNWIITQTDRFASAITQRCVSDWAAMWYSCDFAMFTASWFRAFPFQDPAAFAARSPLTFIDRVRTPLLVLHSEEDWRTPIAQGEMMFRGLKALRKPVAMVRFPGENHELSRSGMPSRRVQNQQHIRRWFGHGLLNQPAPEYGA